MTDWEIPVGVADWERKIRNPVLDRIRLEMTSEYPGGDVKSVVGVSSDFR